MFLHEKVKVINVRDVVSPKGEEHSILTLGYGESVVDYVNGYVVSKEDMDEFVETAIDLALADAYFCHFKGSTDESELDSVKFLKELLGEEGYLKAVNQKKELFDAGIPDDSTLEGFSEALSKTSNW